MAALCKGYLYHKLLQLFLCNCRSYVSQRIGVDTIAVSSLFLYNQHHLTIALCSDWAHTCCSRRRSARACIQGDDKSHDRYVVSSSRRRLHPTRRYEELRRDLREETDHRPTEISDLEHSFHCIKILKNSFKGH